MTDDDTGHDPDPDRAARQVVESLTAFSAAHTELLRLFARRQQMHPSDAAAVVQVIEHEDRGTPLTPARLAERIGLSPGATSILLARLEEAGAVSRTREHADRRVVTLRSTRAVNEAADRFFEPVAQRLVDTLGALDADDVARLARATDDLRAALQAHIAAITES